MTPWGEFVKAWGWSVDKTAPAEPLQVCAAMTGCQKAAVAAKLVLSREALEGKSNVPLDATEGCSEPRKACTVQISKDLATFLAVDPQVSKALFTEGTSLYELNVDKAAQEDRMSMSGSGRAARKTA